MFRTRHEKYNQVDDECCWPTSLGSAKCVPCDFSDIDMVQPSNRDELSIFGSKIDFDLLNEVLLKYQIILTIIKQGTVLSHGTLSPSKEWWKYTVPKGDMVWFTTGKKHQKNIAKSHILKYIVKRPLLCFYERNIGKKYGVTNGHQYYQKIYPRLKRDMQSSGIRIDGYVGCNECEIGLENLSDKIIFSQSIIQSRKFID